MEPRAGRIFSFEKKKEKELSGQQNDKGAFPLWQKQSVFSLMM
jgi:hypothetical protein